MSCRPSSRLGDRPHWSGGGGGAAVLALAVVLTVVEPLPVLAQPAGDDATVQELRRTVRDLQRRVRELERRLAATAPVEAQPPPKPARSAPRPPPPPSATAQAAPAPSPPVAASATEQVSKEEVATALERALVQQGAALLPLGTMEIEPSLDFTRQETNGSTVLLQGTQQVVTAGGGRQRSNVLTGRVALRFGLPFTSQLALSLPYRYVDTSVVSPTASGETRDQGRSASGLGDLDVELAKQLLREGGWRPDLVATVAWDTDTGQSEHGIPLGSGFNEITGRLTASKSQDPLVFVGDLTYTHAFEEGGVQPGDVYGLSVGTVLAASPETALRFFLDEDFVQSADAHGHRVAGSDTVAGVFRVGASSILSRRMLLDAELGIGLTDSAPDYTFRVSLPIRLDLPFF